MKVILSVAKWVILSPFFLFGAIFAAVGGAMSKGFDVVADFMEGL